MNGASVGSESGLERKANDGERIGSGGGCQIMTDFGESKGGYCGGLAAVFTCFRWLHQGWWC